MINYYNSNNNRMNLIEEDIQPVCLLKYYKLLSLIKTQFKSLITICIIILANMDK